MKGSIWLALMATCMVLKHTHSICKYSLCYLIICDMINVARQSVGYVRNTRLCISLFIEPSLAGRGVFVFIMMQTFWIFIIIKPHVPLQILLYCLARHLNTSSFTSYAYRNSYIIEGGIYIDSISFHTIQTTS